MTPAGHQPARGFPAFPPVRGRGGTGRPWWVAAWHEAVDTLLLDRDLVAQGRRLARTGQLGPITVTAGGATTTVTDSTIPDPGSRPRVSVCPLTDPEWERLLSQTATRAGLVAALLAGELPRELLTTAESAGVDLLPGPAALATDCTCPEGVWACRHAAALAHQLGWLLTDHPQLLFLLRGRDPSVVTAVLTGVVDRAARRARDLLATLPAAADHGNVWTGPAVGRGEVCELS